jgi:hypothetical protein
MATRKAAAKAGTKPAVKRGTAAGAKKPKARKPKVTAAQRRRAASERKEAKRIEGELELARDGLTQAPPEKGPAVTTIENAEKYKSIYIDWAEGYDYAALSEKHGLGMRRIRQIVADLRQANLRILNVDDPLFGLDAAQDLILRWSHSISGYAQLARGTKNENIKLGAMRDRDRAMTQFGTLLQELGLMPKHLGSLRVVEDWVTMIDALLEEMDTVGIDLDVQRKLVEAVELARGGGGDVWEGTGRDAVAA